MSTIRGTGNCEIPVEINGVTMMAYEIDVNLRTPPKDMSELEITVTIPDPTTDQIDNTFDALLEHGP